MILLVLVVAASDSVGGVGNAVLQITCGHCGRAVAAEIVSGDPSGQCWLRCPSCGRGSVRARRLRSNDLIVHPGPLPGTDIAHLPGDIAVAWDEARSAYAASAFTASEIMCRKILMHLAVDVAGSKAGKNFTEYVDALEAGGYITTGLKPVVDSIRGRGNVANHDLPASTAAEAMTTLTITEHLLRSIYELPGLVPLPPQSE